MSDIPMTAQEYQQRGERCPKHNQRLMLRQNAKTKEIALACPYCDVEARGGECTRDREPWAIASARFY